MPPIYPAEALQVTASDYSTRIVFLLAGNPEPLCVVSLPHTIAK